MRGEDLNLRPSGYEPDELPGCSTARQLGGKIVAVRFLSSAWSDAEIREAKGKNSPRAGWAIALA